MNKILSLAVAAGALFAASAGIAAARDVIIYPGNTVTLNQVFCGTCVETPVSRPAPQAKKYYKAQPSQTRQASRPAPVKPMPVRAMPNAPVQQADFAVPCGSNAVVRSIKVKIRSSGNYNCVAVFTDKTLRYEDLHAGCAVAVNKHNRNEFLIKPASIKIDRKTGEEYADVKTAVSPRRMNYLPPAGSCGRGMPLKK